MIIPTHAYGTKREQPKKVKLATQDKSKKCSHSKCGGISVITINMPMEQRRLCQKHYDEYKRRYEKKTDVLFVKASKLGTI